MCLNYRNEFSTPKDIYSGNYVHYILAASVHRIPYYYHNYKPDFQHTNFKIISKIIICYNKEWQLWTLKNNIAKTLNIFSVFVTAMFFIDF